MKLGRVRVRMDTVMRRIHEQARFFRNMVRISARLFKSMSSSLWYPGCVTAVVQGKREGYDLSRTEHAADLRGLQSRHDEIVKDLQSLVHTMREQLDSVRARGDPNVVETLRLLDSNDSLDAGGVVRRLENEMQRLRREGEAWRSQAGSAACSAEEFKSEVARLQRFAAEAEARRRVAEDSNSRLAEALRTLKEVGEASNVCFDLYYVCVSECVLASRLSEACDPLLS
jgi:hypothetical protein